MLPSVEAALRDAAVQAGIIDVDLVGLPIFADAAESVRVRDDGSVDPETLNTALNAMQEKRPALFIPPKGWHEESEEGFREREAAFRENLRQAPSSGESRWRDIDAGRLNAAELAALDKAVTGNVNAFDRGLLAKARARQALEDAALPRDAA